MMFKKLKNNGMKRVISAISATTLIFSNVAFPVNTDYSIVCASTGEYKTWKQKDPQWGSMSLGGSSYTVASSGCAVCSVAFLLVHSGCLDETEINPGILCDFLNKNGGLDKSGNIYWGVVSKLVPEFTFSGTAYLYGSTAEEKTAEIKSYIDAGYYVISDVKYSGHWVAIDKVEDGVAYSIDSASYVSNVLFEQYDFRGATRLKLYRKGDPKPVVTTPPSTSQTEYKPGTYITTDVLNVRTEPSTSGAKISLLNNNVSVKVTEVSSGWGKITVDGSTGWICLAYTRKISESTDDKKYVTGTYIVNDVLNYREKPDIYSETFGLIPVGTQLNITEISDSWGKTVYNNKECWIYLDYADFISSATTEAVVTTVTTEATTTTAVVTTPPVETTSSPSGMNYITTDVLNFRTGAGTSNSVICIIPTGTNVLVSEIVQNWGKIVYNGSTGWICLDYARCTDIIAPPPEATVTTAPVTTVPDLSHTEPTTTTTVTTTVATTPATTTVSDIITTPEIVTTEAPVVTAVPQTTTITTTTTVSSDYDSSDDSDFSSGEIYITGDITNDGKIDIMDVISFVTILLDETGSIPEELIIRADLNGDGIVSARDYAAIKMIVISNFK